LSAFLLLKSQSLEALGDTQGALQAGKLAATYGKDDRYVLQCYKKMIRRLWKVPAFGWMQNRSPLILITTCQPNLTKADLLLRRIRATTDATAIIVYGDPTLDDYSVTSDTLIVPCSDDYLGLPAKLVQAHQFLYLFTRCYGVLKVDDDIYIKNGKKFEALMDDLAMEPADYLGSAKLEWDAGYHLRRGLETQPPLPLANHAGFEYCNGTYGYYLSRHALKCLFEQITWHPHYLEMALYEDMLVGELLFSAGISPLVRRFDIQGGYLTGFFDGNLPLVEQISGCQK
jgi:hypothetical protein